MKTLKHIIIVAALSLGSNAFGGLYSDALAKKMVSSTTTEEKTAFVRWMFVAMSSHPDLKDMSLITPEQRQKATRKMGEMMTRMLTVTCVVQAKEAIKYEGASAMTSSFSVFGQIAVTELLTNKEVTKAMDELGKSFDGAAVKKELGL